MPSTPRSNQNRSTSSNSRRTLGAGPVEVRLLGREQVQVPLARRAVRLGDPGPARAAEDRLPVVRRQVAARAAARPEPEPVPLRRARAAAASASMNHGCWIGAVIGHHVDDDPDAERVRLGDQRVRVRERAEHGLDVAVVGDVVAGVGHRRRVPGVEPDRVDAQLGQVRQVGAHAGQVADRRRRCRRRSCARTAGRSRRRATRNRSTRDDDRLGVIDRAFVHGEPAFSRVSGSGRCHRGAADCGMGGEAVRRTAV